MPSNEKLIFFSFFSKYSKRIYLFALENNDRIISQSILQLTLSMFDARLMVRKWKINDSTESRDDALNENFEIL